MPSSSLPTYRDKHLEDYPTEDKNRQFAKSVDGSTSGTAVYF
jgi:hypothetical protein